MQAAAMNGAPAPLLTAADQMDKVTAATVATSCYSNRNSHSGF